MSESFLRDNISRQLERDEYLHSLRKIGRIISNPDAACVVSLFPPCSPLHDLPRFAR